MPTFRLLSLLKEFKDLQKPCLVILRIEKGIEREKRREEGKEKRSGNREGEQWMEQLALKQWFSTYM